MDPRGLIFLDYETRSRVNLKAHGARRYAADPSTSVLCGVAVSTDWDVYVWTPWPVAEGRWKPGESALEALDVRGLNFHGISPTVPPEVLAAPEIVAHNAVFDRLIWENVEGLPTRRWLDSMPRARRRGLPAGLDKLGSQLYGLGKDSKGAATMKQAMKPRKGKFIDPDPQRMAAIVRYCIQDALTTARAWEDEDLGAPHADDSVLRVSDIINERGVLIDVDRVKQIMDAEADQSSDAIEDAWAHGVSATTLRSSTGLRAWLSDAGLDLPNVQKETVRGALQTASGAVADVLAARLAVCKVTAGKGTAILDRVCPDGRLRGMLAYYGAHTGRWAGRGFQPQNLPRPTKGVPIDIEASDAPRVAAELGVGVSDVLGSMLRGVIVGAPRLVQADYASIEARALLWLAGDDDGLEVYRRGEDPYQKIADQLGAERAVGKVAVLACISEGSPVLTKRGWVPIEHVLGTDQVWDGREWVHHQGLVYRGDKPCINVGGIWLTPDHQVLTAEGWTAASNVSNPYLAPGTYSDDGRCWANDCAGPIASIGGSGAVALAARSQTSTSATSENVNLHNVVGAPEKLKLRPASANPVGLSGSPTKKSGVCGKTESALQSLAAEIQKTLTLPTTEGEGYASGPPGWPRRYPLDHTLRPWSILTTPSFPWTASTTVEDMSRGTYAWPTNEPSAKTPEATEEGRAPRSAGSVGPSSSPSGLGRGDFSAASGARVRRRTYDLLAAGPRNRFQAGPLIVHNCGYGGGAGAFSAYAEKMGLDLGDLPAHKIVETWRDAHTAVAGKRTGSMWHNPETGDPVAVRRRGAWGGTEASAWTAVREGQCGSWEMRGPRLHYTLPSGRELIYRDARIEDVPSRWSEEKTKALTYAVARGQRVATYGGKLVENITQAFCRDILAEALIRLEAAGLRTVLHIHDEVLVESDDAAEVARIMEIVPKWAAGMPIAVEASVKARYGK